MWASASALPDFRRATSGQPCSYPEALRASRGKPGVAGDAIKGKRHVPNTTKDYCRKRTWEGGWCDYPPRVSTHSSDDDAKIPVEFRPNAS